MSRNARWRVIGWVALVALAGCRPTTTEDLTPEALKRYLEDGADTLDWFFNELSTRRITANFADTPVEEALNFVQTITTANCVLSPDAFGQPPRAVNTSARYDNTPISVVFEDLCECLGAEWTICPTFGVVAIMVDTPENIAKIEKQYPKTAARVREYRCLAKSLARKRLEPR